MSKQVMMWRHHSTPSATAVRYASLVNGQGWYSSSLDGSHYWGPAGAFSNLEVTLATAPGAGKSRTFTVLVDGSDTALTVTISDTDTTAQVTGVSVAITAWQKLSLKTTPSGTPTDPGDVTVTVDFDSTVPGQQGYGCSTNNSVAIARSSALLWGNENFNANSMDVVPIDCTINGYGVSVDPVLSSGTWTAVIELNGVDQDGSGGTVDTRLVFTSASGTDQIALFTLPVAAGDTVRLQFLDGGGSSMTPTWGVLVTADVPGYCMVGASSVSSPVNVNPHYNRITGTNEDSFDPTEVEAIHQIKAGITPFTLENLYVQINLVATGYQFTLRKNGASTTLTATCSGTAEAQDNTHQEAIEPGDLIAVEIDPIGSPPARTSRWGFSMFARPTGDGVISAGQSHRGGPSSTQGAYGLTRVVPHNTVNIFGVR